MGATHTSPLLINVEKANIGLRFRVQHQFSQSPDSRIGVIRRSCPLIAAARKEAKLPLQLHKLAHMPDTVRKNVAPGTKRNAVRPNKPACDGSSIAQAGSVCSAEASEVLDALVSLAPRAELVTLAAPFVAQASNRCVSGCDEFRSARVVVSMAMLIVEVISRHTAIT